MKDLTRRQILVGAPAATTATAIVRDRRLTDAWNAALAEPDVITQQPKAPYYVYAKDLRGAERLWTLKTSLT